MKNKKTDGNAIKEGKEKKDTQPTGRKAVQSGNITMLRRLYRLGQNV
jgi:hypothetical protein